MPERDLWVNAGGRMLIPPNERIRRKLEEDGGRRATPDEEALFRLGREHVPGSVQPTGRQPPVLALDADVPATVLAGDTEAPGDGVTEAELESGRLRPQAAPDGPPAAEEGQPPQPRKRRRTRRT